MYSVCNVVGLDIVSTGVGGICDDSVVSSVISDDIDAIMVGSEYNVEDLSPLEIRVF